MEAPREKVLQKVGEWLARADEDLQLATYALTMQAQSPPYRLIAYHAQQCAEKCLNAYLICRRVDFPRTPNIFTLLELCSDYGQWPLTLRDAEELTDYAVETRYPGEAAGVTAEDAKCAIENAERVRAQVHAAPRELGMEVS